MPTSQTGGARIVAAAGITLLVTIIGSASGAWQQQQKLVSHPRTVCTFGQSISISGDFAVLGGWLGGAYIFQRPSHVDDPNWHQQCSLVPLDNEVAPIHFGGCVSISGEYAVAGAAFDNENGENSGSAYVFRRSDETGNPNWDQHAKLLPSDGTSGSYFGFSVSISGNYSIIGTASAFYNQGKSEYDDSAYIFKREGADWIEQAKLTPTDAQHTDQFARSVAIGENWAMVGAPNHGGKGVVYVFQRQNSRWIEHGRLLAQDGQDGDGFGLCLSMDGDYAIVGASWDDDKGDMSGSAYIFKREGQDWVQQAKLTASDGKPGDHFGTGISIQGQYAVVGSSHADSPATDSGSAYIFARSGAAWRQVDRLVAADGAPDDRCGASVAICGDCAIVGAYLADGAMGCAYSFLRKCPTADLTGDCSVDFLDLTLMAGQWLSGK